MPYSIGLIHEHQCSDRDNFVEVTRSSIVDEAYSKDYEIRDEALLSEYMTYVPLCTMPRERVLLLKMPMTSP